MPPRKKRILTVLDSSDGENAPPPPGPKKRKASTRKAADSQDHENPPPKKPRGRPRKSTAADDDGPPSAKKPKRHAGSRLDDDEDSDLLEKPGKKQKNKAYEPTEGDLQEIYLTQLPQDDSSPPWRIRGPIWQKPKDEKPPPKPPVFYRPPAPPSLPAQSNGRADTVSRPAIAHAPQQRLQNQNQIGMQAVKTPHETPKARKPSPKNPGPFYSSPFSSPVSPRIQTPQRNSPTAPRESFVSRLPETAHSNAEGARAQAPSRPVATNVEADMELDPEDFSSSPLSALIPITRSNRGADTSLDNAETAQRSITNGISAPVPPIDSVEVENFFSSPPSSPRAISAPVAPQPPLTALDRDEFDDEDLDDIDESLFQRLVSQGPPAARNPTAASVPARNHLAQETHEELLDLPSDAFSLSSMTSPEFLRAGRAQDQAIVVSSQDNPASNGPRRLAAPLNGLRQTTLFGGPSTVPPSQINKRQNWPVVNRDEPPTHHKIDLEAMKTWVYPTNLGNIRDYQFNIVQRGLYHNLLVALPTGLGKTFIAATIMLNFLRWTTDAQIVFVAPTKPLVAQQIDACLGIAGIRRSQTTMLTGEVDPGLRAEEWKIKRVFFMTPQTMINDLKTGYCDAKRIALLVVDEAHRATGAYAYVEIVKFIRRFNQSFRVLALTATPGADVETVQKVIDGLEISRVEIRMENSMDIQPFIHKREVEKKVLRDNKDLLVAKDLFSKAIQPVLDKLNQQNAYWSKDPLNMSLYGLTQSRANWMRSDAGRKASQPMKGMINSIFQALMSLGRGIDVLKFHGLRPFYRILCDYKNDATTKWKKEIANNPNFEKLMKILRDWTAKPDYIGHPKLEHLREYVLNHFLDAGEAPGTSQTKVMVFAHWRDSAEDIVRVLKLNEPMIRPHVFVGQAATKTSEAMDQRRQEEVVRQFKSGVYNTLVATSIGEEGLDIGEVDLIVCYDQKASPIRMLQRMGRTGRKRRGKILLLQMEGKEENDAFKAKDAYEKMQEKISRGDEFKFHTDLARRIVPRDINPVVEMKHIEIPIENSQPELPMPRGGKGRKTKRPPKKFQMPDGVITGFVSAAGLNGGPDEGQPRTKRKSKKAPVIEEMEPPVPAEETFLNSQEVRQLQRFYQNIHDADDDREIASPALTLHPKRQRRAGRTRYISTHSRATMNFVKMVNRMHAMTKSRGGELEKRFRDSLHMSDIEAGPSADEMSEEETMHDDDDDTLGVTPKRQRRIMDEVGEGGSSSPPPTDPRMRVRSQAIDLGTQDTEGEDELEDEELDSELADFIADDAEAVEMFSSSLPSIRAARHTKLFTSSQRGQENSDDDDDELPDISQLVRKQKRGATGGCQSNAMVADSENEEDEEIEPVARHGAKRRRVVDDSDSD